MLWMTGDTAAAIGDAIESGMVGVNSIAISTPETPFGGVKESGYGSKGGVEWRQEEPNKMFVRQNGEPSKIYTRAGGPYLKPVAAGLAADAAAGLAGGAWPARIAAGSGRRSWLSAA